MLGRFAGSYCERTAISGGGHSCTIRGSVALGLAGHSGYGYGFDADGSWVEVPSTASLNPGRRDFSYSAWVNLSVAPGAGMTYDIVRKGLSATKGGEYKLEIVPGGRVKCEAKDSARVRAALTGPKIRHRRRHLAPPAVCACR